MDPAAPKPRRRLSKGMYILPSMFTIAGMAAGFYAILEAIHASTGQYWDLDSAGKAIVFAHLDNAAKAIGFAFLFDGLDGRIARMTGTTSDFGKELDSLSDVIAFGIAPAVLAWVWGFHLVLPVLFSQGQWHVKLTQLGAIACFIFLMTGASRLARFNITTNPQPSNPGRPGKKYFVGLPIPVGAAIISAVVHFRGGEPLESWYMALTWAMMVITLSYLMVSTWRFYSFKDVDLRARRPFRLVVFIGVLIAALWFFSRPVLLFLALFYMVSGIFWRLQWIFRRRPGSPPPPYREASHAS